MLLQPMSESDKALYDDDNYWLVCIKKLTNLNIKMKKKKLRCEYNKKFIRI